MASQPTVQISNPRLVSFVEEQVKAGRFESADAVVAAALNQMIADAPAVEASAEDEEAFAQSESEYARGEFDDAQVVADRLRQKLKQKFGAL